MPDTYPRGQAPAQQAPPGKGQGAGAYPSPEEQLKEAQGQLQKAEAKLKEDQGQVAKDTATRDDAQKKVAFFDKVVKEINQASGGYAQAKQTVEQDKKDLDKYADLKTRAAVGMLGPGEKDEIDKGIKKYDEETIPAQQRQVHDLAARADQAAQDYDHAQAEVEQAQAAYDGAKAYLATVQGDLKKVKDLRKPIDDSEAAGQPRKMYVYVSVMKGILDHVVLKTEDQVKDDLNKAWNALHAAKDKAGQKQGDLKKAQQDLQDAQKKLQELIDKRTDNLVAQLGGGPAGGKARQQAAP